MPKRKATEPVLGEDAVDSKQLPDVTEHEPEPEKEMSIVYRKYELGSDGVKGISGSITYASMARVLLQFVALTGFGATSVFADVGASIGRVLLHASIACGVQQLVAIEFDSVKVQKGKGYLSESLEKLVAAGYQLPAHYLQWQEKSICMIGSLSPVTHVYAFWCGWSPRAKAHLVWLFRHSPTCQSIAIVDQDAENAAKDAGLFESGIDLLWEGVVTMMGSGRKFKALIFTKNLHYKPPTAENDLWPPGWFTGEIKAARKALKKQEAERHRRLTQERRTRSTSRIADVPEKCLDGGIDDLGLRDFKHDMEWRPVPELGIEINRNGVPRSSCSATVIPLDFSDTDVGPHINVTVSGAIRRLALRDIVAAAYQKGGEALLPFLTGATSERPFNVVNTSGKVYDCRASNVRIEW